MEKYHLFVLVLELSNTPPEAELKNLKMIPRGQRYMTNPPAHPQTSPYCEQKNRTSHRLAPPCGEREDSLASHLQHIPKHHIIVSNKNAQAAPPCGE